MTDCLLLLLFHWRPALPFLSSRSAAAAVLPDVAGNGDGGNEGPSITRKSYITLPPPPPPPSSLRLLHESRLDGLLTGAAANADKNARDCATVAVTLSAAAAAARPPARNGERADRRAGGQDQASEPAGRPVGPEERDGRQADIQTNEKAEPSVPWLGARRFWEVHFGQSIASLILGPLLFSRSDGVLVPSFHLSRCLCAAIN